MGILFSSNIDGLGDLVAQALKTTAYAEEQIVDALPKMIDKTTDPQLRTTLDQMLTQAKGRVTRIEQTFGKLGIEADTSRCAAIDGILKADSSMLSDIEDEQTRDAAIAFGTQMACHYGIAQYGTMSAWFRELGRTDIAEAMTQSAGECGQTDQMLTQIAETRINRAADARGGTVEAGTLQRA